ncbi:MAG: M64 family metallopeptidase [Planctomycetota bacterium]
MLRMRTGLVLLLATGAFAPVLTAQVAVGPSRGLPPERMIWCDNGPVSADLYGVKLCGPVSNRVNLVFVCDGYRADELSAWAAHVDEMVERLFSGESPPYERYRNFINVYRVDLVSNESGIDRPGAGVFVDTALDGCNCCTDYTIGQCQVDWAKTHAAINHATPGIPVHWRLVGLNTAIFLGGAHYPPEGNLAVYATRNYWRLAILAHEGAHAFHWLGDEYFSPQYANDWYTGGEPFWTNLTIDPAGSKWAPWIGFAQPGLGGPVAAYEGGMVVYGRGIWHPSPISRMSDSSRPLDAVGKERAIQSIYEIVDPVDVFSPDNSGILWGAEKLFIRVVDPAVIGVDWLVDGQLVRTGEGTLNLTSLGIPSGFHVVEAVARDEVLDHAFSDNSNPHPLDLVRREMDRLSTTITWMVFTY